jgi:hypothetical protein
MAVGQLTSNAEVQVSFEDTGTAVSGGQALSEIVLSGHGGFIHFEVDNSAGTQTITDCILQLKDHPNGEFYNYKGGTDWDATNDVNIIFNTTLGVQEVTATNRAHACARIDSAYSARFVMKAASASAVTVRGTIRP